ncbi:hypothetical protein [Clostridium sartagoforme]|jgi:hypothetical protein|uniref:hypothetical protein n=1 Tax=Clostridium sartagoforme TaxID=84031 RepID=UPI0031DDB369
MDIRYRNEIEDYVFFSKYFVYKYAHFDKIKYFISSIAFISGIYYSIELDTIIYFFTNSIAMTSIVFYLLRKIEPNYINKICNKIVLKNFNKYKDMASEKTLSISDESITINYEESIFKMKLNEDIKFDVIDKYITIFNIKDSGYKNKIIIPINIFKSEDDKNKFIKDIEKKIRHFEIDKL